MLYVSQSTKSATSRNNRQLYWDVNFASTDLHSLVICHNLAHATAQKHKVCITISINSNSKSIQQKDIIVPEKFTFSQAQIFPSAPAADRLESAKTT